ncbi:DUF4399 domain-containing protein [Biformimicrobium ophioploci]|uniref:DUF4399 domain-containing protein n=1 Tax=Biformimicrobium ophioploci TaxID=3036711 RepID=A0ABQ6M064_9GAMM|nr:DUF4399 domain-containing protein [Microbulbifer sp. NKW57]GMG87665.1 DUF4399 domain-containing protein [Microbulbifer sp. NKW57]
MYQMGLFKRVFALVLALGLAVPLFAGEIKPSKAPEGVKLYIIEPVDGATVKGTFKVKFGLSGMGVAPAGVDKENTGHHHLLINIGELPDLTKPLPATDQIKHFGGGQTETEITLPPGKHTLQLLLGNFLHIPHDKPVLSEKITITVEK